MRQVSSASIAYTPGPTPAEDDALRRYVADELQKISAAIVGLSLGHLDKTTVAPAKPRDGDVRYADGTAWNPGSGQGIYAYYGLAWHFLG